MNKSDAYPTWKRSTGRRWVSNEGQPNSSGEWVPDVLLMPDPDGDGWLGKSRTSAKWQRFETAADAKTYYEHAFRRV